MRYAFVVLSLWLCSIGAAFAQVSVSIGFNVPVYPQLVRVPGYPVYYAPQLDSNYFFYDGLYWVYDQDNWYASTWYNGPWELVVPDAVPLFILRVPVRYYRRAPVYFRSWRGDAPPRWHEHWGSDWGRNHRGWDNWNRRAAPAPAPLPVYQRQYSGSRYPGADQQSTLQVRNYRYEPRDAVVRQQYRARLQNAPAAAGPSRSQGSSQQVTRAPASAPPARSVNPAATRDEQRAAARGNPATRDMPRTQVAPSSPQAIDGNSQRRPAGPISRPQSSEPAAGAPAERRGNAERARSAPERARSAEAPGARNAEAPGRRSAEAPGPRNAEAPGARNAEAPGRRNAEAPGARNAEAPGRRNAEAPGARQPAPQADRPARAAGAPEQRGPDNASGRGRSNSNRPDNERKGD
jgi:hypothetical protein